MNIYEEAHLFVAATRVCQHKKQSSPPLEDICSLLGISVESGHSICRKLEKLGIVEIFEDPFNLRLTVADHLQLEKLPREEKGGNSLAKELEQFMAKKKNMHKKIESIQAEMEAKKKSMFSELEAQLKKKMQE